MWMAYAITGAIFVTVALAPEGRTWGAEAAAWVSPAMQAILALLLVAVPLAVRARPKLPRIPEPAVLPLLLAAAAVLFGVFRATAWFLGDGAQNVGMLGESRPPPKLTSAGTWLLLLGVRRLIPGEAEAAARAAYALFAGVSGLLFVASAWLLARPLVPGRDARLLLTAALVTGGWSLQFFGYFENYAPFVLAVTAFAMSGAQAARTGTRRWLPAVLAVLAAGLHVLGALLVPPLLMLFKPARVPWRRLAVPLVLAGAAGAAGAAWFVTRDLSRALLFVPVTTWRFGVPGYTWFSPAHLLDLLNLALLLIPGILVLVVARIPWGRRGPRPPRDPAVTFLAVTAAGAWLGVFLFDPKLGMPRDWDLFAFAGPPLLLALAVPLLARMEKDPAAGRPVLLAAALGALVLAPRVAMNRDEPAAYEQFRRHLTLDHARGRNATYHSVAYLKRAGREEEMEAEIQRWLEEYPERKLVRLAIAARARGDLARSTLLNEEATRIAPTFFDSWQDLGTCYRLQGRLVEGREAYRIAMALNPGYTPCWVNMGLLEYTAENLDAAEHWWRKAWKKEPEDGPTNQLLAVAARDRADTTAYAYHLERAAVAENATVDALLAWSEYLTAHARPDEASRFRAEAAEALQRAEEAAQSPTPTDPDALPQTPQEGEAGGR